MEQKKSKKPMTNLEFALATALVFFPDAGLFILIIFTLFRGTNFFFVLLFALVGASGSNWVFNHYDYLEELKKRTGNGDM